jgi:hypothetical protein
MVRQKEGSVGYGMPDIDAEFAQRSCNSGKLCFRTAK